MSALIWSLCFTLALLGAFYQHARRVFCLRRVSLMSLSKSKFVLSLLGLLLLAGCASPTVKPAAEAIYWPKPPAPPRFVYVTTLRSGESIRPVTTEDRLRGALTGVSRDHRILAKPFGVAARDGLVVVTDTAQQKGFIFNLRRQNLYHFGHVGKEGVMTKPMGAAIGADDEIFVADVKAQCVYVYDAFGMYLRTIGSRKDLDRPVDVAVSPDGKEVFVVDAGGIDSQRHRVVVYDTQGVKRRVIGRRGEGRGEFNLPNQVALAPDGTLYVLDAGNFRIQAFSAEGKFLRSWGGAGRDYGNFARPRGLAVDSDGNVYVSDAAYRNFQVFNPQGQLLLPVGGDGLMDEPGQFAMPAGMAVDELGDVYIVDQLFGKVDVIRRLKDKEMNEIVAERRRDGRPQK
jgi:DNA-binding beta-propeller fold protein YncE